MAKVDKETLKSGNVLRVLRNRFLENPIVDNLSPLFACMIDSDLYVPMNLNMSDEDMNIFKNSKVGDVVTVNNQMKMKPDWLKNGADSDELFFPVFSSVEEATEEYGKNFSWINLSLDDCIKFARNNDKCIGIVLDAYTKPCVITGPLLDALENMLVDVRKSEEEK